MRFVFHVRRKLAENFRLVNWTGHDSPCCLVQKKDLGICDENSSDGDALLLACSREKRCMTPVISMECARSCVLQKHMCAHHLRAVFLQRGETKKKQCEAFKSHCDHIVSALLWPAFVSNLSFVSFGKGGNEIMRVGQFGGLLNLLLCRCGIAALNIALNIACDGSGKQGRFLSDASNQATEVIDIDIFDVHAIEAHRTTPGVAKTLQHLCHRGLSTSTAK